MALIDNVNASRVKTHGITAGTWSPIAGIDWDDILEPIIKTARQAIAQEVWEWLDANPKAVIFRLKIKVWVLPINWTVKAKDAIPFVEFLLGPRPY